MKIAVTYEKGQVFQHFGHTEAFKVYEIEGGAVRASRVIGTDGFGHKGGHQCGSHGHDGGHQCGGGNCGR